MIEHPALPFLKRNGGGRLNEKTKEDIIRLPKADRSIRGR
jgi:hypothetical protein